MKKQYRWDIENRTKVGQYLTGKETDFINVFLKHHKVKKCLELGCGSGRFTKMFYNRGIEIIGLDHDQLPLELLHKKLPKVKTLCIDIGKKLPFKTAGFDTILAIQFVDYITDMVKFLRECHRLLKKNGYFLFTLSNKHSYKTVLHTLFGKDKNNYSFSYSQMRHLLGQNGFKLMRAQGYHWIPFYRSSNHHFVSLSAKFEEILGLKNLPALSPGVMYLVKKK